MEDLARDPKKEYTITMATRNTHQAARVPTYAGFLTSGELTKFGPGDRVFATSDGEPTESRTAGRLRALRYE